MFDGTLDTVVMMDSRIVGLDSSFSKPNTGYTGLVFPVDYTTTLQQIELQDVERTRLVALNYTVQKQFVSEECTPRFFLSNLQNLPESTDSVKILSSVLGEGGPHVAVYRCPRNNFVRVAFQQIVSGKTVKDTVNITSTNANNFPATYYPITGSLSYINLALNEASNTTELTFTIDGVEKTMTFTYDKVQTTKFERCGVQNFITNVKLVSDIGNVELAKGVKHQADSIYDPPKINFAIIQ